MSNGYPPNDEEYNPSADPAYLEAMMAYLMGAGGSMMPSMDPAQMDTLYGAVPGSLNPTQQGNYLQDYLSIMADPMVSAMAGSGAYGPDAFAPTTNYEPIAQPGRDQLLRYTQMPGTIEAFVAEHILGGGSASSALAELRQSYEAALELPEEDPGRVEVESLVGQLPASSDPMAEPGMPDWGQASQNFLAMQQVYMSDPQPGTREAIIDPETGEIISPAEEIVQMMDANGNPTLVRMEQEASPAAEWYRERGLSLPTDEYTAEDLMGPEWALGQGRVMEALDEYEREQAEFDAATQAVEGNQQQTAEDEAFAQAVMEQAIMSGYRPPEIPQSEARPGPDGEPTPFPEQAAVFEQQQAGPPEVVGDRYDPLTGQMTGGYMDPAQFPMSPGASPTEQMFDAMPTSEQHEFINENLDVMTPEELEFTLNYLTTHAPFSQTPEEIQNWESDIARVEQAINPSPPSSIYDHFVGEGGGGSSGPPPLPQIDVFGQPTSPQSPAGDYGPLSSTDASRILDLRPAEEPEETLNGIPFSELSFVNGSWRDRRGNILGYAPTEDSDISPTPPSRIPRSEQVATGLDAQGRRPGVAPTSHPAPNREQYAEQVAGRQTGGQQSQAQLRFLIEQSTAAARQGGESRRSGLSGRQQAERSTRDQAYQRYLRQAEQTYNKDYGRTMYDLYQMQQRGIRPLQQQMAARRQVPIGMGLSGGGHLPGMG